MDIIKEIEKKKSSAQSEGVSWLDVLALGVGTVNLPIGLLVLTISIIYAAVLDSESLSEAKMGDDWLKTVGETETVSKKGLAFLSKELSRKGYISVKDASSWLDIEKKEVDQNKKREDIEKTRTNEGASLIFERAKKECGSLIDITMIEQGITNLKKMTPLSVLSDAKGSISKYFTKNNEPEERR